MQISPQRREEILAALRKGTVPGRHLETFSVGLDHLKPTLEEELQSVQEGGSQFKAIRGEYGCGKTFFARWLAEKARRMGFVTAEVQISETETPLHRLETVYRRLSERMLSPSGETGGFRDVVDGWFYTLEEDVIAKGGVDPNNQRQLLERTAELMNQRLEVIRRDAPMFSNVLRGYRAAMASGDRATAEGLLNWLSGQPHVAASAKRAAGIKGDIDHYAAMTFLQGILAVIRDSGQAGLLVILDEVETIQRVRSDIRDKSMNALRQLIDEVDSGRYPGLYLLITGTPAFFTGPQGIVRLEPLAQRLHVDFLDDSRFDNPRAVQIRLPAFDRDRLNLVGRRVREIYCEHTDSADRIRQRCDDDFIHLLAERITGKLGGKVGVAPRIFLKKLVGEILDRVDLYPDFDPSRDYRLTLSEQELSDIERAAMGTPDIDQIELEL